MAVVQDQGQHLAVVRMMKTVTTMTMPMSTITDQLLWETE